MTVRPSAQRLVPVLLAILIGRPVPARAEPWFGSNDGPLEDRYLDGDLGVEDIVDGLHVARSRGGSERVRTGTWLTVGSFFRVVDRREDIGALLLVNVAFDRIAQGPRHQLAEWEISSTFTSSALADGPAPPAVPAPPSPILVTRSVARRAVTAAWRAANLGVDDARIDAMVARARASAALPETRLRVMKVFEDSSQVGVIPTDTSTYDILGANLYLEARLTWRLDRLLYADDEPTLERTRLERQDARERIAGKVIDCLFQWQRAKMAQRAAAAGSKEAMDAVLRLAEAEPGRPARGGGGAAERGSGGRLCGGRGEQLALKMSRCRKNALTAPSPLAKLTRCSGRVASPGSRRSSRWRVSSRRRGGTCSSAARRSLVATT
jgi:hypothetical protein